MQCPECKSPNPEFAKFCIECGRSLSSSSMEISEIPSFEEKLEKIQRYLPMGLTEKILTEKDKIEGERRHVTVMFCDMRGFTPLTEKLGPEGTFSLMDQVFEVLIHKIHEYKGTVNELRGDGILALFGAPIALEDAPQRAIRASLAIHQEMKKFNDSHRYDSLIPPIFMRIGINSGPVVVGSVGNDLRVQFAAVGDTINMAARMEGMAEPGTTYITKETFELTDRLFYFQALGEKNVKGKEKTIPVYKVLSSKKDVYRPRLGSERMIYSDMIGRDKELDRLELQVMKAKNGQGSIVNIIGEAGIGKSRLVAELKKRDVMKRVNLLEGRAISIGRNLSFHPIIDFIKKWALINQEDSEAASFYKLERTIRDICKEDVNEVLPFVATLMGMNLSGRYADRIKGIEGEALEKLIIKNVRELLIKATEMTPLVIVTEDLHWADTTTIELLESLYRLAETQKVLFVNVFRPGYKETGDRIVETIKESLAVYYVEILMEPLDEQMSEALITSILNVMGSDYTVIPKIVERAGGNPFFIEEVVRSFIDEGAVVLKNGTFEVTDKISTIAIPHTINEVLMARIDGLDEKTRKLVKIASVIGRNFFYRILADVAITVRDIDRRLSDLKQVQLIREQRRMDEVEYLFKHALVQEVAYESILRHNRKEIHLQVACSIENIFGDRINEFYGMLAYHYSKADSLDKTEEYLVKAGEEALRSSASNEALNYYQEALGLYLSKYGDAADPERITMLEKNIALALYNKGQYDEAVVYFDKALNYYWGKLPKHPISTSFIFMLGFFSLLVSIYIPFLMFHRIPTRIDKEAVDLFNKKLKVLPVINPRRFFFESFIFLLRATKFDLNQIESGIGLIVGVSTLFSFTGISFMLSRKILHFTKNRINKNDIKSFTVYEFSETLHKYLEGNWDAIGRYDDDLVKKNLSIGEIYWASQHLFWHSLPNIYQGHFDIVELIINRLKVIFELYDNEISILLKQLLNTSLLMECRKIHDALNEIEIGIDFGQKTNQGLSLIHMFSCKARVQMFMGDIEGSENSLENADKIRHEVNTIPWQLSNFLKTRLKYDLYRFEESIRKGNKTKSFEYSKKAIRSGKKLLKHSKKVAQHRVESYKLMGDYYWLRKKQKRALSWWNSAIKEGERLGARLALSRTYFEVGKRLLEPESKYQKLNGINAKEYLEKARILFEEMNLQWDLDELGRVSLSYG